MKNSGHFAWCEILSVVIAIGNNDGMGIKECNMIDGQLGYVIHLLMASMFIKVICVL